MSKRKRDTTEGESASINGLKKARKHQQNAGNEEGAEENDIVRARSNGSVNGHAIASVAHTEEEKLAFKLVRKQAKKEKRRREKDQMIESKRDGDGTVDIVADTSKKSRRQAGAAGGHEEGAEENNIVAARSNESVNGHVIASVAKTEGTKLAIKLVRKQAKKEKRQREKDRMLESKRDGDGTVDIVADTSKKSRRQARAAGGHEEGAEENDIVTARSDGSVNGHAIASVAKTEEEKLAIKLVRKKAKKEKRQREKDRTVESKHDGDGTVDIVADTSKKSRRRARAAGGKHTVEDFKDSAWRVSDPVGGRLLDLDPVFTPDEKYLLLAYDTSIHVYSTSTSLLIRKLTIAKSGLIVGFVLSPTDVNLLYVATNLGSLYKHDWDKGKHLGRWDISSQIFNLSGSDSVATPAERDVIYTVDRKGQWMITAHRLSGQADPSKTELRTLLKSSEPVTALKVLGGGKIIVASSGPRLMIGSSALAGPEPLNDLSYVWREILCPEWISSLDARIPSDSSQVAGPGIAGTNPSKSKAPATTNIVIGDLKGAIFVYEDLLGKLIRKERHGKPVTGQDLIPQRLHWHRNEVSTVKWSLDGNYVISGGLETVLILWQLETGRQQQLPHLSAAIESIVVSPSGSSYAILLADNSAMVLSTAELQPITSIPGIQVPTSAKPGIPLPYVARVDAPPQESTSTQPSRLPSSVNPSISGQLLLAVPTSLSARLSSTTTRSAAQLQTVDVASAHQISRQALTRTNVTVRNMGPEGNIIEEPCVKHIQVSCDGQWLATIDEWQSPTRDLAYLAFDERSAQQELDARLEVHLKFWSWNSDLRTWELVARIDNPHAGDSIGPPTIGKVLDLTSDPSSAGFATIADDSTVRIWTPKNRYRNGIQVRGKDGKNLTNWICRHSVPLQKTTGTANNNSQPLTACLAYSQDGSLLAAGSSQSPTTLNLIDTDSGEVRYTRPGLYSGRLMGLGVVDRYLIILSNEIAVWDLVDDELHYGFSLKSYGLSTAKEIATTHLAVHPQNHTFAIALPEIGHSSKTTTTLHSRLAVFDPELPTPLVWTTLPNTVIALLPATGRKGYYAVDSAAEIRTLTPAAPSYMAPPPAVAVEDVPLAGLENIYGAGKGGDDAMDVSTDAGPLVIEDDDEVAVVRPEDLAGIFEVGPAFALPPVVELLERVAGLCSRKGAVG